MSLRVPESVDPAIRKLLSETIGSVESLEVLLRLSQQGPAGTPAIAKALGLPEPMVGEAVTALVAVGLVERQADGKVRYLSEHPQAASVAALGKLYDDDRIIVLRLITQLSIERVRSEAARLFADAFVFRSPKKPKGEPDA